MKKLFFLLLILGAYPTLAQHTFRSVDRAAVEQAVTAAGSSTYYPTLLARFAAFDTTLSTDEYRLLYYGYVFQPAYQGYNDHKKKDINTRLRAKDYTGAAATCDSVLQQIPVSLTANYFMGYALFAQDKANPQIRRYFLRYRGLRDAILSSGNGLGCETAFKTIFVDDEYDILYKYFEVERSKGQSLVGHCDVLHITPSAYFKASDMYFDTSETLLAMQRQFKK